MPKSVPLSASLEDYLEVIFHIISEKQVARAKEIASRLNVSRSSVTEAFRSLAKKGLINYEPYEVITLTSKGKKVAVDVVKRHETLKSFFVNVLAVDDVIAEDGACRIEHSAPQEIIERLIQLEKYIAELPGKSTGWIKGFKTYCESQKNAPSKPRKKKEIKS